LAGLFLSVGYWGLAEAPAFSRKPNLTIELRLDGRANSEAVAFRDQLVVALSNFQTVTISAPDAITASVGNAAGGVAPPSIQSRYRMLLKYGEDRVGSQLWWHVLDEASGETVRAGFARLPDNAVDVEPTERLAARLATQLASPRGVINRIETDREVDRPTLGNGCVVRAVDAMDSSELAQLGKARDCLERSLALRENDADAHAVLAGVLLMLDSRGVPSGLVDRAVKHAGRAVELAPDSDRGFLARMMTQFRLGNSDAAIRQAGMRWSSIPTIQGRSQSLPTSCSSRAIGRRVLSWPGLDRHKGSLSTMSKPSWPSTPIVADGSPKRCSICSR
jgi:hypothetical protein